MSNKQPKKRFRVGSVTAAVWENDKGFYSVTLQKSYKDDNETWQNTDSLNAGDCLNAAKALERAEQFISEQ